MSAEVGVATAQGRPFEPRDYEVPSKVWAAKQAARVLLYGLTERLTSAQGLDVPRSGDDITADWLTERICCDHPGARVVSIERPGGSVGTTTRRALRVTYNDAGREAGLPVDLYVKCTTALAQRLILGLGQFIEGEWSFYRYVRPEIEIEAPRGYWGEVDPKSWRSVTVMDDVAAQRGATFWSTSTVISKEMMMDLLSNTAVWHGRFWNSPKLHGFHWLKTPEQHLASIDALIGMEGRSNVGHDRAREVLPAWVADREGDLYEGLRRSVRLLSGGDLTYLHGDFHVGNTYQAEDGAMGIGDWQIGVVGGWAYDYSYIVATGLAVEDRRAWERELLAYYLERLEEEGGPKLEFDTAFDLYRAGVFYGHYAWAYTIGRPALAPKYQPDEISLVMLERTGAALDDLESLRAVGL
jgi:Phosphotransferase enzyme family